MIYDDDDTFKEEDNSGTELFTAVFLITTLACPPLGFTLFVGYVIWCFIAAVVQDQTRKHAERRKERGL